MRSGTIAMVTCEYAPDRGGVADYTAKLVAGLVDLGVDVQTIVVRSPTRTREPWPPAGVRVQRLPRSVTTWLALVHSARRCRWSVLHLQYVPHGFARHGLAPDLILFAVLLRLVTPTRL